MSALVLRPVHAMMLTSLSLQNFRNYANYLVEFDQPTTVIVGPNAVGKTSIIEAIHLLATGNSFRAEKVEEMIRFSQELARVKGVLNDGNGAEPDDSVTLEVVLTRGLVQGKRTALRLYSVNDVRRRKREFTSNFSTVVFRPENMRLVEGSPTRRRTYLDNPLSSVDKEYERSLSTYERALTRRNRLLQQVREGEQPRTVLTYWNLTLVKHGSYITDCRRRFLEFCQTVQFPLNFTVGYDSSVISEDRIRQYQDREIAAGHTLIGPHKDDIVVKHPFQVNGAAEALPISAYGSRGQQRMAVLWLKVCEFEYLKYQTKQTPLLLLDDILSELDEDSRARVLSLVGQGQSIITTAEPKVAEEIQERVDQLRVMEMTDGRLE